MPYRFPVRIIIGAEQFRTVRRAPSVSACGRASSLPEGAIEPAADLIARKAVPGLYFNLLGDHSKRRSFHRNAPSCSQHLSEQFRITIVQPLNQQEQEGPALARRQKEYVFPEEDRAWPSAVLLIAFTQLMLLICGCCLSFSFRSKPKLDSNHVIVLCIAAAVAVLLALLLLMLKDDKGRSASYEFTDDSVCIRMWRTVRTLNISDHVRISVKTLTIGYRIAPIENHYYMLWKEGMALPKAFRNPFHVLQTNDILFLPHNEKVRQQLIALFGEREALMQDAGQGNETNYVFSERERGNYFFAKSVLQILPAVLLSIFINIQGKTAIALTVFFCGLIYMAVINVLLNMTAQKSIPDSFTQYWFSEDAVFMRYRDEERVFRAAESLQVSYRALVFAGGRSAYEEKYIVLWKSGEPQPKDHVAAFLLLGQSNIIILPGTVDIRNRLQKALGVKDVGYWVTTQESSD